MDFGLSGKNVLVTGGTKGLGRAICEVLAKEGANPMIVSRSKDDVSAYAAALRAQYGVDAMGIAADLSQRQEIDRVFDAVLALDGALDVLINNAGIWPQAYVVDMEDDDFSRTLEMNLVMPFILCKRFVQHLREQNKRGKIVNIVSQAAFHGSTTGHAHYAASKGGLVAFSISLAREVAPYGINVNSVAPGIMNTPMFQKVIEENGDYYKKRIPLGRIAEPEEVAYAVAFLSSDKADYLTGITLDATGGMLMR